jgi:hypothetical protein
MKPADEPLSAGSETRWRTVILRHDVPDGSSHFDWMFEPPAGFPRNSASDSARLVTFRCDIRPDQLQPGTAQFINRLPDHRDRYLDYEGPVSGDRGTVMRIRRGEITGCRALVVDGDVGCELVVEWRSAGTHSESQVIRLISGPDDCWTLFSTRQNPGELSH